MALGGGGISGKIDIMALGGGGTSGKRVERGEVRKGYLFIYYLLSFF